MPSNRGLKPEVVRGNSAISRSDRRNGWFLAGYAGVGAFFLMEVVTREPGPASSLDASKRDQSTTVVLVAAYALALSLTPMLRRVPSRTFPRHAGPTGVVLEAVGLGLRAWSMRTLGRLYS